MKSDGLRAGKDLFSVPYLCFVEAEWTISVEPRSRINIIKKTTMIMTKTCFIKFALMRSSKLQNRKEQHAEPAEPG